jgi:hypothetical protein
MLVFTSRSHSSPCVTVLLLMVVSCSVTCKGACITTQQEAGGERDTVRGHLQQKTCD